MLKPVRITLYAIGGVIGTLLLVAFILIQVVDANTYKAELEAAISDLLGMEIAIDGRLRMGLLPGFHIALEDVHLRNRGTEVIAAEAVNVGVELLPLLANKVRIENIHLSRPRIYVELGADGKFNFEKADKDPEEIVPALALAHISVSSGIFRYLDKKAEQEFTAEDFELHVSDLLLTERKRGELLKHLSLTAKLACRQAKTKNIVLSDLTFSIQGQDGVFDVGPIAMRVFGGTGAGSVHAEFVHAVPSYHVRYSLSQFHIDEFLRILAPETVAHGSMDFSLNLAMQGKHVNDMKQTAHGDASLQGENLTLTGIDLDKEFARFESSQRFNLVDVGAFFFAGPAALAITKGYSFASMLKGSGGSSNIRRVVSRWNIERGVAHAGDVALATNENRIALKGDLDFVHEQFDDVTMALIDDHGCPRVRQKIRGPFRKPVVEKPNVLVSIAGPAIKLLKQAKDIISGAECQVFYSGSVAPPK